MHLDRVDVQPSEKCSSQVVKRRETSRNHAVRTNASTRSFFLEHDASASLNQSTTSSRVTCPSGPRGGSIRSRLPSSCSRPCTRVRLDPDPEANCAKLEVEGTRTLHATSLTMALTLERVKFRSSTQWKIKEGSMAWHNSIFYTCNAQLLQIQSETTNQCLSDSKISWM